MNRAILATALLLAAPTFAQTANDDMQATENWWDEVGADFFGAATLSEPRPEFEIRAQWTGLSADDQAAVRARCAAAQGEQVTAVPFLQEGSGDDNPDASARDLADNASQKDTPSTAKSRVDPQTGAADTTTTGSVGGAEQQSASTSATPAPDTGLAGATGDEDRVYICDIIATL